MPGLLRRDCEPHRGHPLCTCGVASAICGAFSLLGVFLFILLARRAVDILALLLLVPFFLSLVTGIAGLSFGAVTGAMAWRDLDRIQRGLMDSNGRSWVSFARALAFVGVAFSALSWAIYGILIWRDW